MTALSRSGFNQFIQQTLPDNSSREISALDLRTSFLNLADSISNFNRNIDINSLNFGELTLESVYAGSNTFARKNVTGFSSRKNTALGYSALESNYSTSRNTAVGSYALSCVSLGNDNVGVGSYSLGGLTIGSGNVAIGNYALLKKKSGNFNIALGHGAGYLSEKDSDFNFYVGVYPDASGDCETTLDSLTKAPLLYGNLQTLQLAIGASGFRGDEKLSVSGNILPYESGVGFSLGSGQYRWDAYIEDLYISGDIVSQNQLFNVNLSDGTTDPPDLIINNETVFISGISGIHVGYTESDNVFRVSAHPVSGFSRALSEYYALVSGVNVSGYLLEETNLISGISPDIGFYGPSGLAWNVSGWARAYSDSIGAAAGAYTHWRIEDESSVGQNITEPSTSSNTLTFAGVSGVFTNYRSDTNTLEISAHPVSGFMDASGNAISGWARAYIDASGNAISGWSRSYIDTSGNAISGWSRNYIDSSGSAISGWADYHLFNQDKNLPNGGIVARVSGYAEGLENALFNLHEKDSGYLLYLTNLISGVSPNIGFYGPSGLAWNVSGWVDSTFVKSANADPYEYWTLSDSTTSQDVTKNDRVIFYGEKGIDVEYKSDISTEDNVYLEISANAISGYIDASGNAISGFIDNIIKEGGYLEEYYTNKELHDDLEQKIFSGPDVSPLSSLSGTITYTTDSSGAKLFDLINNSGNAISGWTDYNFFNKDKDLLTGGIVARVSGYVENYADEKFSDLSDQTNPNGLYGHWKLKDDQSATRQVTRFDGVKFTGSKGISTTISDIDGKNFKIDISANSISGYIDASGNAISGFAYYNLFEDEGRLGLVSGWSIRSASGYADASGNAISGFARGYTDASGNAISGWADYHLFNRDLLTVNPDAGVIAQISGWAHGTFAQQTPGGSYTKWTISDTVTQTDINNTYGPVNFLGISGIITNWRSDTSTLEISANPASGFARRYIDASGNAISGWTEYHFDYNKEGTKLNRFYKSTLYNDDKINGNNAIAYADTSGNAISGFARGYTDASGNAIRDYTDASGNAISGWADYHLFNQDKNLLTGGIVGRVSGYFEDGFYGRATEVFTAGTGITLSFNSSRVTIKTDKTGSFNNIVFNKIDPCPEGSGQIIADTGSLHDIVNTSGYLVVPRYQEYEELITLNKITPNVGSGVVAFAGGHLRVSDGNNWNKPIVIEGFLSEDLTTPTDFSTPTSGIIVTRNENFQAANSYYVTNRDNTFAASNGFYMMAMLVNNEYRPVWSSCSS